MKRIVLTLVMFTAWATWSSPVLAQHHGGHMGHAGNFAHAGNFNHMGMNHMGNFNNMGFGNGYGYGTGYGVRMPNTMPSMNPYMGYANYNLRGFGGYGGYGGYRGYTGYPGYSTAAVGTYGIPMGAGYGGYYNRMTPITGMGYGVNMGYPQSFGFGFY